MLGTTPSFFGSLPSSASQSSSQTSTQIPSQTPSQASTTPAVCATQPNEPVDGIPNSLASTVVVNVSGSLSQASLNSNSDADEMMRRQGAVVFPRM